MTDLVDLTIHINEKVSSDTRTKLQDEMRNMNGIMMASSRDKMPHFLMIGYDPKLINSNEIVHFVKNQGMQAQIIGL